jgi:hypothetical protein
MGTPRPMPARIPSGRFGALPKRQSLAMTVTLFPLSRKRK